MNIGYIGLDHHHRDPYLDSIERLDATVTAVCEPSGSPMPGAVSGLPDDVPFYTDPAALLDAEPVDLAWLTLPNADTPAVIRAALARDVDVFTEKPAARTAAELEPVVETARVADATVCVSLPWRAHPIAEKLRSLATSGFFGQVEAFETRFAASRIETRDTDHYLFDAEASNGGIVQWLGVHWLDLLPWVLDDPIERVHARTRTPDASVDVETGAMVQLETASGAMGTLSCGYYLREGRYDTRIDVFGSEGRSEWEPIGTTFGFDGETTLELDAVGDDWESTPHRSITYDYESTPGYGGQWGLEFLEDSLAATTGSTSPPVTLDDALTVLRVTDAVYESAASGQWVDVDA